MTRARLIELQRSLEGAGWSASGYPNEDDLFLVEEEKIVWKLRHANQAQQLELVFFLFDPLGRQTEKLADVSRVDAVPEGVSLYFSKINSRQWEQDLTDFVQRLR